MNHGVYIVTHTGEVSEDFLEGLGDAMQVVETPKPYNY
jgi:hypothetical protein